jgi:hypothetical protein
MAQVNILKVILVSELAGVEVRVEVSPEDALKILAANEDSGLEYPETDGFTDVLRNLTAATTPSDLPVDQVSKIWDTNPNTPVGGSGDYHRTTLEVVDGDEDGGVLIPTNFRTPTSLPEMSDDDEDVVEYDDLGSFVDDVMDEVSSLLDQPGMEGVRDALNRMRSIFPAVFPNSLNHQPATAPVTDNEDCCGEACASCEPDPSNLCVEEGLDHFTSLAHFLRRHRKNSPMIPVIPAWAEAQGFDLTTVDSAGYELISENPSPNAVHYLVPTGDAATVVGAFTKYEPFRAGTLQLVLNRIPSGLIGPEPITTMRDRFAPNMLVMRFVSVLDALSRRKDLQFTYNDGNLKIHRW